MTDEGGRLRLVEGGDGGRARELKGLFLRWQEETFSLLSETKGVVVVQAVPEGRLLNLYDYTRREGVVESLGMYDFLPVVSDGKIVGDVIDILPRNGTTVQLTSRRHPGAQYLVAFKGEIQYECILECRKASRAEVIATDKVGQPIAVDYEIEGGRVIFLPPFPAKDTRKAGGVLVQVIRRLLGKGIDEAGPDWVTAYSVHGLGNSRPEIEELERKIRVLDGEKADLESKEERLRNFQILLYGQGKYALEPIVREAFRVLGFDVREPDTYEEEYDLHLACAEGRAIGEIEGVDAGPVDLEKYRQLLDYVDRELSEKGATYKGILVGNGYRQIEPKKRRDQFTPAARKMCVSKGFCMITTEQLFYAVNAVLVRVSVHRERPDHFIVNAKITSS